MDYKRSLEEVFDGVYISQQLIENTIALVLNDADASNPELLFEMMLDILIQSLSQQEEGAVGISFPNSSSQMSQIYERLLKVFPDICPSFLSQFCSRYNDLNFEKIVDDLTNIDYPKAEKDPLDTWEHLKQMLPNADPSYLRNQARVLVHRPAEELAQFISDAIDNDDYPTMKQYLIKKELDDDIAFYISNFSVEQYLEKIPNPTEIYSNPERKSLLSDEESIDFEFALIFLYNQFVFLRQREIKKVFFAYDKHLVKTSDRLKKMPKAFRHPRELIELPECKNIELLKEIAFLKYEKVIKQCLKQKDIKYRTALEEAAKLGLLETCPCCFDDQLIPEECYFCNKGCIFCKECVQAGSETVIGKEETRFPCLARCDSEFSYATLQMVLDAKTMRGVWYRKQVEEIKNANPEGLETCPFCDFCMVPVDEDKIFKCQNVSCMIESCRLCRHKSHIPLRCNEIEYDEDVQTRTHIENKMTEALLRRCWKCSRPFYKESGCNKMTCSCGATMCYVCGAAVDSYSHFNNDGCPLYTDNLQAFHLTRVLKAAESAKSELGINQDPSKLKFDPTRGIENDIA